MCVCVLVAKLCPTLCDPMDCGPPGSPVHGILQARILEWIAIPFPGRIFMTQGSNPDLLNCLWILYHLSHKASPITTFESERRKFSRLVMCPTLCDPMDCSLPGSSIHGIFQAKVLEWVAISFSRGSSWPRDQTRVSHIVGRCSTIWATREVNSYL